MNDQDNGVPRESAIWRVMDPIGAAAVWLSNTLLIIATLILGIITLVFGFFAAVIGGDTLMGD